MTKGDIIRTRLHDMEPEDEDVLILVRRTKEDGFFGVFVDENLVRTMARQDFFFNEEVAILEVYSEMH